MKERFLALIEAAFSRELIKKVVFSRPEASEIKKVSGRLCLHRDRLILALEYSLTGDTVSHKNVDESELSSVILPLIAEYRQVNLITTVGEAEYKRSKSENEIIVGEARLKSRILSETQVFERAIESLDREHNYILSGGEDFLKKLGISDKSGRVHDKKQGKFRQINRFLENIEGVYSNLPSEGELKVYDLCCGKSYLSFAVYYYLHEIKKRDISLLGIDLKRDVIEYCSQVARECGFSGMCFITDDVTNTPKGEVPDMVISLHACDVATDVVINTAISLGAGVILSTPCCHRYLNGKVITPELSFVTDYPHLQNKLCEALTDALRILRLRKNGYSVKCIELTDPTNTPKNTLIRAVKNERISKEQLCVLDAEYDRALQYLLGDKKELYLKEI